MKANMMAKTMKMMRRMMIMMMMLTMKMIMAVLKCKGQIFGDLLLKISRLNYLKEAIIQIKCNLRKLVEIEHHRSHLLRIPLE
jgi:hypothetical protein